MAGGSMKKWRRNKIKGELAKQTAEKTIGGLRDMFLNPTEEQLYELSQIIANIALEDQEESEPTEQDINKEVDEEQ